jgi:RNA polymerase sigma factor (TIGR02999 family)
MKGDKEPLQSDQGGDGGSAAELLQLVYEELRKLAAGKMNGESSGHTLQATALVHEAWIRLGGPEDKRWDNPGHFFGAAAEAMRRILIDHARRKRRPKHGGDLQKVDMDDVEITAGAESDRLVEVHELLDRLAEEDPRKAEAAKLKFFVGLSNAETALAMGVSEKTVNRHWRYAKAWLYHEIQGSAPPTAEASGQQTAEH